MAFTVGSDAMVALLLAIVGHGVVTIFAAGALVYTVRNHETRLQNLEADNGRTRLTVARIAQRDGISI